MPEFVTKVSEFVGEFSVNAPISAAFELFSPEGERRWVPEWAPTFIHPREPGSWTQRQVFTTVEDEAVAVWVVTALQRENYRVEYHRIEAARYVARVTVKCMVARDDSTTVRVVYQFVGLSEKGNADVSAMTTEAYVEKMRRWERWIRECLTAA